MYRVDLFVKHLGGMSSRQLCVGVRRETWAGAGHVRIVSNQGKSGTLGVMTVYRVRLPRG